MSYLIAVLCLAFCIASWRMNDRSHAILSLAVGTVFLGSRLAFDYLLPSAQDLGHLWYAYCIYGEIAIILGTAIAATKSPASMVVAALSIIAIWANAGAAEAFVAGGGPAWERYPSVIMVIQSAQMATIALYSPPALAAMLWLVEKAEKREGGQWQARVAQ